MYGKEKKVPYTYTYIPKMIYGNSLYTYYRQRGVPEHRARKIIALTESGKIEEAEGFKDEWFIK